MRIETERLILREWEERDRAPFAAFHTDAEVRRYYYPATMSREASDAMVDAMIAALATDGFSFLACERKSDGAFIGEIGLSRLELSLQRLMERPCGIEFGWYFGRAYWGNGYATEAARAWLDRSFTVLKLDELCSISQKGNSASIRLMERLGMIRDPQDDFEDPTVPPGHWQRPHVIYRISNPASRR
jgi:RimJ/RimL family protein N-acetyltransferase